VGRLDGYGPVAEIIRAHHERMDGSGYPSGLIGNEIPRLARIIAICEAFDAMTARTTYRSPMTPQDAVGELRRMAGRQFDPQLVEQFVIMIERDGPILAPDGDHANFDEELAFERRARAIAQPTRSS
jgi:HD-GYP domain-containing protein (c-di-GMP phosphodiesterase class II)